MDELLFPHNDTRFVWGMCSDIADFDWTLEDTQDSDDLMSPSSDPLSTELDQIFTQDTQPTAQPYIQDFTMAQGNFVAQRIFNPQPYLFGTSPPNAGFVGTNFAPGLVTAPLQPVGMIHPLVTGPILTNPYGTVGVGGNSPIYHSPYGSPSPASPPPTFVKEEPTIASLISRLEINENGTVREDKTNLVKIFLSDFNVLRERPEVVFKGLSLGDEKFFDKIKQRIASSDATKDGSEELEEGNIYLFFTLKPNFGYFKDGLEPDSLANVQCTYLTSDGKEPLLEAKVLITKSLRPGHCLKEEWQKKKNNFMNLQVVVAYKPPGGKWLLSTAKEPFWFRSNGGRSNRAYAVKRKLEVEPDSKSDNGEEESSKRRKQENSVVLPAGLNTTTIAWYHASRENYLSFLGCIGNNVGFPLAPAIIERIQPNQAFAFQIWAQDNPTVTIVLLGANVNPQNQIYVQFVNPYNGNLCMAFPKLVAGGQFQEYIVPSLARLLETPNVVCLPDGGLTVDVVFRDITGKAILEAQKFTYLNAYPMNNLFSFAEVRSPSSPQGGSYNNPNIGPISHSNTNANGNTNFDSNSPGNFNFRTDITESEVLDFFKNNPVDVNKKDEEGRTILHCAVICNLEEVLLLVLEKTNSINEADKYGATPLHLAVFLGRINMVRYLIGYGAEAKERDSNGENALDLAIKFREYDIIDTILSLVPAQLQIFRPAMLTSKLLATITRQLTSLSRSLTSVRFTLASLPYLSPLLRTLLYLIVDINPSDESLFIVTPTQNGKNIYTLKFSEKEAVAVLGELLRSLEDAPIVTNDVQVDYFHEGVNQLHAEGSNELEGEIGLNEEAEEEGEGEELAKGVEELSLEDFMAQQANEIHRLEQMNEERRKQEKLKGDGDIKGSESKSDEKTKGEPTTAEKELQHQQNQQHGASSLLGL